MAIRLQHTAPNTWAASPAPGRMYIVRKYSANKECQFEVWRRYNARTQFEANEFLGTAYTAADAKKVIADAEATVV